MSRDAEAVADLMEAGLTAVSFKGDLTREQFFANKEKQAAVTLQLIIMGEATKRLSMEFREAQPQVPWKRIAGMRDQLIHGYHKIDVGLVWDAVDVEVPQVLKLLAPLGP